MTTAYYLEDDPLSFEYVKAELARHLSTQHLELVRILNESDFLAKTDDIIKARPPWILLDCMVMWAHPAPNAPSLPPEVEREGYYEAGLRCGALLRSKGYQGVLVFYSILEEDWIQEQVESRNISAPVAIQLKTADKSNLTTLLLKLTQETSDR